MTQQELSKIIRCYVWQIIFVFVSSYEPDEQDLNKHLGKHGDGVKDVAFAVENLEGIVKVR